MLSRVAEKMYWFGRYVERVENTARLISVNTNLVMDLPRVDHIWASTLDITGNSVEFQRRFTRVDERNVVKFLLEDDACSIRSAVRLARENARTTREIMPSEAWERINELYLFLQKNLGQGLKREGRHNFLGEIIGRCHQLTGLLAGSMSADTAYNFIKIGRNLERADMSSRIVDVGSLNLITLKDKQVEYDNILWMNVLRSLTAYQMYRQHVKDRVNGEDVVDFLLKNRKFPRAVAHCLNEVNRCCSELPLNDLPLRSISQALRTIESNDVIKLLNESGLHEFIDVVQLAFADIHSQVANAWFGHEVKAPSVSTTAG
ncbi:MAG: alpha-E domain-containing protein [SAR86 cluster bacterium]